MSVLVLFESQAADGKADELVAMFAELLPDTRKFDGCESITLHRDIDDPEHLVLVERWGSRAQYEAYLQWRADRGDIDRIAPLMARRPEPQYYDDVDA
jgi:quinol monooxygenase YgiN